MTGGGEGFSAGACIGEPGMIPVKGEFEEAIVNALKTARFTIGVFLTLSWSCG